MKTNQTVPTIAEQKAIIRDCLEKNAYIRQTMAMLFPVVTRKIISGDTLSEKAALGIYQDDTVSISNYLSDIYGHLIGKEADHE